LDEAADFFNHTYGGAMVHLFGLHLLRTCCAATAQMLGEEELRENGFGVHADAEETSALLFLRPELVDPGYKRARSVSGNDLLELSRLAKQPGWPGYIGAPRFASAAIGASTYKLLSAKVNELTLKILDGFDYRTLPRYADVVNQVPGTIDINREALAQEDLVGKRQKDWLNLKEK
jgi:hypothetical protein